MYDEEHTITSDDTFGYFFGNVSRKHMTAAYNGSLLEYEFESGPEQFFRTDVYSNWHRFKHLDVTFSPVQLHFHRGLLHKKVSHIGSENQLNGKNLDLEMHIVSINRNKNTQTKLAASVVSVLFELSNSTEPSFADKFFQSLIETYDDIDFGAAFAQFLNFNNRFVYMGSLTTPPYSENLLWNVLEDVVPIQHETLALFEKVFGPNQPPLGYSNRHVQPLNGRHILRVAIDPNA